MFTEKHEVMCIQKSENNTNDLKSDIKNFTAYTLIFEAMWGRIKALPSSSDQITQIRYPDENLIMLFKKSKELNLDNLEKFIKSTIIISPKNQLTR